MPASVPNFGRFENINAAIHSDLHPPQYERALGTSRVDYISFTPSSKNTLGFYLKGKRRSSLQERYDGRPLLHSDLNITPQKNVMAGSLAYYSRRGSDSKYVAPSSLGIYERSSRHRSHTPLAAYRSSSPFTVPRSSVSTFLVKNKTLHLRNVTEEAVPPLLHVFANRLLGIRSPWKLPTKPSAARNNIQQITGFFTLLERLSDHYVDPESLPTFYNNVYSIAKYMFNRQTTRRYRRRTDAGNNSDGYFPENLVHIGGHVYDIGEYGNKSLYQKYVLLDMCTDSTLSSEFYDSFNRQILEHRTNYRSLPSMTYILDFVECITFWMQFSNDTFVVLNYPGHGFNVLLLFACAIFNVNKLQDKEYRHMDDILESLDNAILDSFSWRNNCRFGTPDEHTQDLHNKVNRNVMESVPSLLEMFSWPASYRRYLHYFIALKDKPRTAKTFRIKHILLNSLLPGVDFAVEVYSLEHLSNDDPVRKTVKRKHSGRNIRHSCSLYSPLLFPRCVCGGEANDGARMVCCEGDYHIQTCTMYNGVDKRRHLGNRYPDSNALLIDFTVGTDGEPRELLVQGDVTLALVLHAKRANRKILATFSFNTAFVNGDAIEVHKSELDIWDPEFPLMPHSRLFVYVEKQRGAVNSPAGDIIANGPEKLAQRPEITYNYPSGNMETFLKYHVGQVDEEDVKSLVRTLGCSPYVCKLALKICKKYSDALELLTSEEMQIWRDLYKDVARHANEETRVPRIDTRLSIQEDESNTSDGDTAVSEDVIVDTVRTLVIDEDRSAEQGKSDTCPERGESISSPHFETSREESLIEAASKQGSFAGISSKQESLTEIKESIEETLKQPSHELTKSGSGTIATSEQAQVSLKDDLSPNVASTQDGLSPSVTLDHDDLSPQMSLDQSPQSLEQQRLLTRTSYGKDVSQNIVSHDTPASSLQDIPISSLRSVSVSSLIDGSASLTTQMDRDLSIPFIGGVGSSDLQIDPGRSLSPGASMSIVSSATSPLPQSVCSPLSRASSAMIISSAAVSPENFVKSPSSFYPGSPGSFSYSSASSDYLPCIDIDAVVKMEENMKEEEPPVTLDQLKGALQDELQKKLKRKDSGGSNETREKLLVPKSLSTLPKAEIITPKKAVPPVPKEKRAPPVPKGMLAPPVPTGKVAPKGKMAPPVPTGKIAPPLPKGKTAPKLPMFTPKVAKRSLPLGVKLHWKPLSNARLEGTIFEAIKHGGHGEKNLFDVTTATKLFTRENKQVLPKRVHAVSTLAVLDAKRAQNIGIVLRFTEGLYDAILDDVDKLNTDSPNLTLENLHKLATAMPTELEREKFTKYFNSNTSLPLQPVEKDVVKLLKKDMEAKIRISKFTIQYKSAIDTLKSQLDTFDAAVKQIRGNTHLPILLSAILQYGNFVNHGDTDVKTYGFTLSSAIRLVDLKSSDKSITSLHYLIINLAMRFPDTRFNEIDVSLESVLLAEKVSAKGILDTLEEIRTELGFLVKFSESKEEDYELMEKIDRIMNQCKDGICDITTRQEKIFESIRKTWTFLGEEYKQGMALEEIFQILADLAKSVKKVFTDIKNRPNKFLVAISDQEEREVFMKRFVEKRTKLDN
ncbi:Formin 2 Domain containing protein [Theileria equi strain WA]|uniref:Formin 2 Domain containing protein n=1 Tax=Theileria equi strain WA TaxID=1537102 RepID=L1LCK8_THEEQ|nr:Formin 2 Domain containing protein [Theileria equi strain WA]EKX73014.1 Formin 2 Domain containing protein [Theileria equi strain WA]|eukprot:XP_004832466.1 Formin 2 Domain containing protein [Theileria equi strain WA]